MLRHTKEQLVTSFVFLVFWSILGTMMYMFLLFPQVHTRLTDLLHDEQATLPTHVTLVGIDQKSLSSESEGGLGRWQDWRRSYYAKTIEHLRAAGATVIGVDVFFSEPSSEGQAKTIKNFLERQGIPFDSESVSAFAEEEDRALRSQIEGKNDIVLAADATKGMPALVPDARITGSGAMLGSVTLVEDSDNILRRVPLWTGSAVVPHSFAFRLFLAWTGAKEGDFRREQQHIAYTGPQLRSMGSGTKLPLWNFTTDTEGTLPVRFRGAPLTRFPLISFVDAYNNAFDPSLVAGKIVLIGEVDAGLHDNVYTPVSFGQKRPGVEVHAQALESLINNDTTTPAPIWYHALFTAVLLMVLLVVGMKFGAVWGAVMLFFLLASEFFYTLWAFDASRLTLSSWYIGLALVGTYASLLVYKLFLEQRDKKQAIKAFSHYVSDKVANMMIRQPSLLRLGGEKRTLSVSFTDIANFTTISEQLTPEQISDFLRIYLERMTNIVLSEDGTLDKYIGDALMCLYGAPLAFDDHALRACRAALAMHAAIPDIQRALPMTLPPDLPLAIRTGIGTGEMVVGNFGSQKRFDYTAIGDTVNTASRLEGANKQYSSQICVNEATYLAVQDACVLRTLDIVRVKGKHQPVKIYELLSMRDASSTMMEKMSEEFERAFLHYQGKDFLTARDVFESIHATFGDAVSAMYVHRCNTYLEKPPAASWDGVYVMTSK
ncbi:hypothetical protein COW46_02900 [Candidatus Gracilibacteria bacterium CG17_big_fil_post_rev_8_21_14_2_50_48_13]|nr:MAG: hypothetical protein COW46_02900 [Candidatus Gracilibacteria bacterium CG17_big_fil_post_rev_8_21_14_2_50_48_13]